MRARRRGANSRKRRDATRNRAHLAEITSRAVLGAERLQRRGGEADGEKRIGERLQRGLRGVNVRPFVCQRAVAGNRRRIYALVMRCRFARAPPDAQRAAIARIDRNSGPL